MSPPNHSTDALGYTSVSVGYIVNASGAMRACHVPDHTLAPKQPTPRSLVMFHKQLAGMSRRQQKRAISYLTHSTGIRPPSLPLSETVAAWMGHDVHVWRKMPHTKRKAYLTLAGIVVREPTRRTPHVKNRGRK